MSRPQRSFYFIFVTVASWIFLNYFQASFALETETHKAINRYIAQQGINKFSLNTYLIDQLGMKEGTETYFKSGSMDQQIYKWIGDGGVKEDDYVRPRNHFYDPITNKGLSVGKSAFEWATLPVGEQNFSWNDACLLYTSEAETVPMA